MAAEELAAADSSTARFSSLGAPLRAAEVDDVR
jgi:hypothetical protein